jgi:hypothetical protein
MGSEMAVAVKEGAGVMNIQQIMEQKNLIVQVMKSIMKKDIHYGTIPGCGDKEALFQAGAEILAMTFRLDIEFETETIELPENHREYRVKAIARHIQSGNTLGSAIASCSTMESKYRYRWDNTGVEVPKEYWNGRDSNLLGGMDYVARKGYGQDKIQRWYIFRKVEHTDPADYYNTCLRMAEKRAKVGVVRSVTGASDIFTTEDAVESPHFDLETGEIKKPTTTAGKPIVKPPQKKESPPIEAKSRIITGIEDVMKKESVTKDGKPYTIFTIYGKDNIKFTTFSETFAQIAKSAKEAGLKVVINYDTDKFGHKITELDITDEDDISSGDIPPWDKKDEASTT